VVGRFRSSGGPAGRSDEGCLHLEPSVRCSSLAALAPVPAGSFPEGVRAACQRPRPAICAPDPAGCPSRCAGCCWPPSRSRCSPGWAGRGTDGGGGAGVAGRGGGPVRPGPAGQALPVGRRRTRQLRLLRPGPDQLQGRRGPPASGLAPAVRRREVGLAAVAACRRPALLRPRHRRPADDLPRRDVPGRGPDSGGAQPPGTGPDRSMWRPGLLGKATSRPPAHAGCCRSSWANAATP
jgi:hypothetical protein